MGQQDAVSGALGLVAELCGQLESAGISYCHWKSNEAIDRSASGENDLDLLVERRDADRFREILAGLGFKQARPGPSREIPGLIDYYGLDGDTGRFVHLQAHYQLVLGDDMTKNYRLPVEADYLASVGPPGLIRLPAPDFELAVFAIRMVLKHATWDAQLSLLGRLSASEARERAYLFDQVPPPKRSDLVAARLPMLSRDILDRCLAALEHAPSRRELAQLAAALEEEMAPYARHPRALDVPRRVIRRFLRGSRRLVGRPARKKLTDGGGLVALSGERPDFVVEVAGELETALGRMFPVKRFSFAGPDPSDTERRARRWSTNGGIALCVGFPADRPPPDLSVTVGPAGDIDAAVRTSLRSIWAGL